jgi:hypothetical protein
MTLAGTTEADVTTRRWTASSSASTAWVHPPPRKRTLTLGRREAGIEEFVAEATPAAKIDVTVKQP